MTQRDTLLNVRSKVEALSVEAANHPYAPGSVRGAYKNCLSIIDQELDKTPPLVYTYEAPADMDSGGAG